MFTIKDLLEKFKTLKDPIEDKKKIAEIIKNISGAEVSPESINFKKDGIVISTNSVFKNAIYMKKPQILKEISLALPERNIHSLF